MSTADRYKRQFVWLSAALLTTLEEVVLAVQRSRKLTVRLGRSRKSWSKPQRCWKIEIGTVSRVRSVCATLLGLAIVDSSSNSRCVIGCWGSSSCG